MEKKTWKNYFANEEELVKALMDIDVARYQSIYCKGWGYIEGFQKYYNKNGQLTKSQLTQLKRLASEIDKYYTGHSINGATREVMRWN